MKEIDEAFKLLLAIEMKAQYFPIVLDIQRLLKQASENFTQIQEDKAALMERMGEEKAKK